MVSETECEHCERSKGDDVEDNFDEDGYPLPKHVAQAGHIQRLKETTSITAPSESHAGCFRFLDLPPEIRNRIYEIVTCRAKQPVCVPDSLLRPSEDLPDTKNVRRECSEDVICLPCQLHGILGSGSIGLSRASKQLHAETALIPYTVNTFNLHNLYYLRVFLELIGEKGRQSLKSLKFSWRLPEEEAHALGTYTSVVEAYILLGECKSLVELSAELDVINMLTWRGNGNPRSSMLNYVLEIPHIARIYELRGLKDVTNAWTQCEGLQGMEDWAKTLAGYWRLPHGMSGEEATEVDAELKVSGDGLWHCIRWQTKHENNVVET